MPYANIDNDVLNFFKLRSIFIFFINSQQLFLFYFFFFSLVLIHTSNLLHFSINYFSLLTFFFTSISHFNFSQQPIAFKSCANNTYSKTLISHIHSLIIYNWREPHNLCCGTHLKNDKNSHEFHSIQEILLKKSVIQVLLALFKI
jgi:hypothetical protein